MTAESMLSVAMLAGFLWTVRVLLPKAAREHDMLAMTCAIATAVLTLLGFLAFAVRLRGGSPV